MIAAKLVKNACFLYVEDDRYGRDLMKLVAENLLGTPDFTIWADSQDFMRRLTAMARRPDAILLDIHMKPHSGFDVLKMIRADANYNNTKVIALTASVMNEEIAALKSSGFNGAIGKPFDISSFSQLIEQILNDKPVWQIT